MKLKKWLCSVVAVAVATAAFAANASSAKMLPNPLKPIAAVKTAPAPAPAGTSDIFAVRSDLEYLINNTFLGYELLPMLKAVKTEEQVFVTMATALRAGLLAYEKQVTAGQALTGTNAEIDAYLKQVPNVLNKMQQSSNDVKTERDALLGKLTKAIVKNQTVISEGQFDEDICIYLASGFVNLYTLMFEDENLSARAARILEQEIEQALQEQLQQQ